MDYTTSDALEFKKIAALQKKALPGCDENHIIYECDGIKHSLTFIPTKKTSFETFDLKRYVQNIREA